MTRFDTQCDRVLRHLKTVGGRGTTQLDWDGPTPDGGFPIRRLAARIEELRKRGFAIDSAQRRHRVSVYRLTDHEPQFIPISDVRWCLSCGHRPDPLVDGVCRKCGGIVAQLLATNPRYVPARPAEHQEAAAA